MDRVKINPDKEKITDNSSDLIGFHISLVSDLTVAADSEVTTTSDAITDVIPWRN